MPTKSLSAADLQLKLNRETARMHWHELLGHFVAGAIVVIDDSLDLIDVAVAFSLDNKLAVERWLVDGLIAKATEFQSTLWLQADAQLWTVVVRPWVLVQQHKPG